MRNFVIGSILLLAFVMSGCTGIPKKMRSALKIQTKYTRQYVKATLPKVTEEKTRGIGERVLENCDRIDAMIKAEEE